MARSKSTEGRVSSRYSIYLWYAVCGVARYERDSGHRNMGFPWATGFLEIEKAFDTSISALCFRFLCMWNI